MNLKDRLSTYAAYAFSIGTAILGLPLTISAVVPNLAFVLPDIVNIIAGILIAISVVVTQVLTGKNADLTTKTDIQVKNQLESK